MTHVIFAILDSSIVLNAIPTLVDLAKLVVSLMLINVLSVMIDSVIVQNAILSIVPNVWTIISLKTTLVILVPADSQAVTYVTHLHASLAILATFWKMLHVIHVYLDLLIQ